MSKFNAEGGLEVTVVLTEEETTMLNLIFKAQEEKAILQGNKTDLEKIRGLKKKLYLQ